MQENGAKKQVKILIGIYLTSSILQLFKTPAGAGGLKGRDVNSYCIP